MSGDRDMQNLMAALPDARPSVAGPALAHQLERIATALEALAGTGQPAPVDFDAAVAFRWHGFDGGPRAAPLEPVAAPALIAFDALRNVSVDVPSMERKRVLGCRVSRRPSHQSRGTQVDSSGNRLLTQKKVGCACTSRAGLRRPLLAVRYAASDRPPFI
ncbi:hypothetical protein [Burkholderia lata]|uniref:hypothetical protein n=1 Tax=Burkholderia lata (strain ATCC 17760 / DSM 23089 / LMG 22485 / NCIMB 9086 / R18194 / 383) TaxID=482957 RepID=UPI00399AD2AE